MTEFRVWAPTAAQVTLSLAAGPAGSGDPASPAGSVDTAGPPATEIPMTAADRGWWTAVAATSGEVDYGFRLDGGPVRPDPRSRRQLHGVHGRSRTFDAATHRWHDGSWRGRPLAGAVLYEMHAGTFTRDGTLDAAITHLDDLVDLGVDMVELLPVNAFNGTWNWGYDGVLWFAVHEAYGGPAGYQRFVDACHARGLSVIQDVVYNHLGPSGNYLPEFGPYLRGDAANTWGAAVNLDGPRSDEVRRYLLDNARMWFEDFHVDGLRLDAVHALHDTRALTLLEEMATQADALAAELGRPLHLIAESDLNDPRLFTARRHGGLGLTAAWDDDIHHAIHVAVTGETSGYYGDFATPIALKKVLTGGYFHDGTYSSFRGRSHGRPIDRDRIPPWRLVASIQNHDQVGNRAAGDRMNQQAGTRAQAVAAVLLLTAPFTPMLFMGEEWAASTPWPFFTSHPEADLAEKTRSGRLAEFGRHGWDPASVADPQNPATFRGAQLDWSERGEAEHAAMLTLYRDLIALRRAHPRIVTDPWRELAVEVDGDRQLIRIERGGLVVLVNLGAEPIEVSLGAAAAARLAVGTDADVGFDRGRQLVRLPRVGAAVLETAVTH